MSEGRMFAEVRREKKYIVREVSPYLQAFFVQLLRDAYVAKKRLDLENFMTAVWMLFHSLPENVRKDALREIIDGLSGLGYEVTAIEEAFDHVKRYCSDIVNTYRPPYNRYQREEVCRREGMVVLDVIYSRLMRALHHHNIFVVHREVSGTTYKPKGVGDESG